MPLELLLNHVFQLSVMDRAKYVDLLHSCGRQGPGTYDVTLVQLKPL